MIISLSLTFGGLNGVLWFSLDARDYQNERMLAQFHDHSGFFNEKQLELIKALHLPMLRNYPGSNKRKEESGERQSHPSPPGAD